MINLLFLAAAIAACDINSESEAPWTTVSEGDFRFNPAKTIEEYLITYPDQRCAVEGITDVERACFERYKLRWMGASIPFKVVHEDSTDVGSHSELVGHKQLFQLKYRNFAQYTWCVRGINADNPNRG
ncbi:MAG: hypothetical protein IIB71_14120 [Proteobacteria bacterium]|nr:hypothetical protein [Pseudomonadota bacterium]